MFCCGTGSKTGALGAGTNTAGLGLSLPAGLLGTSETKIVAFGSRGEEDGMLKLMSLSENDKNRFKMSYKRGSGMLEDSEEEEYDSDFLWVML